MIRFEVTGETAEKFAENAMKAFAVLAIGLQAELQAKLASMKQMPETSGSENSSTASSPKKPEVYSDPVEDLFVAAGTNTGTPSDKKKTTKAPKLDDLKARLSDIIVANTERWDLKRANAYARKLLKEFGVEKLGDIKPERYDEFLAASAYYLIGNAGE